VDILNSLHFHKLNTNRYVVVKVHKSWSDFFDYFQQQVSSSSFDFELPKQSDINFRTFKRFFTCCLSTGKALSLQLFEAIHPKYFCTENYNKAKCVVKGILHVLHECFLTY
jgi:hypothetical protein